MKTITLYRISTEKPKYDCVRLTPGIYENRMLLKDQKIEPIYTCPTILGCIKATRIPLSLSEENKKKLSEGKKIEIWVYVANVPADVVYVPTHDELPDGFETGEMWIMKPCQFILHRRMFLKKHMDVGDSLYSRYSLADEFEKEVMASAYSKSTYGKYNSFSFIEIDPTKYEKFIEEQGGI